MIKLLTTAFTLLQLYTVFSADILVAVMPQGISHGGSFVPLLDELLKQGHNVTIYMEVYNATVTLTEGLKYWYIDIKDHEYPFRSKTDYDQSLWWERYDSKKMTAPFEYTSISCSYVLEEYFEEYYRIANYPWDLILTDSLFTACGYGISMISKAHYVVMHSTSVEAPHGFSKGYGRHYILLPSFFLDFRRAEFDPSSFWDRLRNTYDWLQMTFMFHYSASNHMQQALYPVLNSFSFSKYYSQATMAFTDMAQELYLPCAKSNELFSYGSYCKDSKALHGELLEFVSDPTSKGTILLAFGTIINWSQAPFDKREAFFEALDELKEYRIIWSYNGPPMKHGKHLKTMNWVPQTDILNDQRTKLFITHGGLKSCEEATCAAVPALFLPIFGEQVRNSWLAKHHGYGYIINKLKITKNYLLRLIRDILNNPSYKNNAVKLRNRYGDAVVPAVKEGAHWINRLLKYGGRLPEYFYTRSTNSNLIKHFNFDLLLIIPVILIVIISVK